MNNTRGASTVKATETIENFINGNLSDFKEQVLKASRAQLIHIIQLAVKAYDLPRIIDKMYKIYLDTEGY